MHPPARTIDTAALKAAFRQRAHELGIDPAAGSTSYQVTIVRAEAAKRTHHTRHAALCERRVATLGALSDARQRRDWWAVVDMWDVAGLVDKTHAFEVDMFRRLHQHIKQQHGDRGIYDDLVTGGYRELISELWVEVRIEIDQPLRQVLARQGQSLRHLPIGDRRYCAIRVPLNAS